MTCTFFKFDATEFNTNHFDFGNNSVQKTEFEIYSATECNITHAYRHTREDFSNELKIPLVLFKCICIPAIIIGNLLIISSFCVFRSLLDPSRLFLISLAVSDIHTGIIILPMVIGYLLNPKYIVCKFNVCLLYTLIVKLGPLSSLWHLFIITVDRFLLIKYPFIHKPVMSYRKSGLIVGIFWAWSMLLSFTEELTIIDPLLMFYWHAGQDCDGKGQSVWSKGQFFMSMVICTVVPSLLYGFIFARARRFRRRISSAALCGSTTSPKIGLQGAIMVAFVVCWLPVMLLHSGVVLCERDVMVVLDTVFSDLAYANSALNPLLYCLIRPEFRRAFKLLLTTWPWHWHRLPSSPAWQSLLASRVSIPTTKSFVSFRKTSRELSTITSREHQVLKHSPLPNFTENPSLEKTETGEIDEIEKRKKDAFSIRRNRRSSVSWSTDLENRNTRQNDFKNDESNVSLIREESTNEFCGDMTQNCENTEENVDLHENASKRFWAYA